MGWTREQVEAAAQAAADFIQGALHADPARDRAELERAAWAHVLMELAAPGGWGEPGPGDYEAVMSLVGGPR